MATDEVYSFTLSVPAGTPKNNPAVLLTRFPPRIIRAIKWRVPHGPNGVLGFRISMGGVQVFPSNIGGFIIADAESETWNVDNQPDSGAWDVTAYNTGTHAHQIFINYYAEVMRPKPVPKAPVSYLELSEVPDLSWARPLPERPA